MRRYIPGCKCCPQPSSSSSSSSRPSSSSSSSTVCNCGQTLTGKIYPRYTVSGVPSTITETKGLTTEIGGPCNGHQYTQVIHEFIGWNGVYIGSPMIPPEDCFLSSIADGPPITYTDPVYNIHLVGPGGTCTLNGMTALLVSYPYYLGNATFHIGLNVTPTGTTFDCVPGSTWDVKTLSQNRSRSVFRYKTAIVLTTFTMTIVSDFVNL